MKFSFICCFLKHIVTQLKQLLVLMLQILSLKEALIIETDYFCALNQRYEKLKEHKDTIG